MSRSTPRSDQTDRSSGPNLVIVESPAKARTISKYLGKDFRVKASMGHIIDLPSREMGVDPENGFEPKYRTIPGKGKVVKELRDAAAKARAVYLAPDPDREGEAIAWHVANVIGDGPPIYRVLFNEITPRGVKAAMDEPGRIDMNLVNAQQARRILDRVVGYMVSPFLWRTVAKGLSAGRVQTVALRLICEREEEIESFVSQEYWTVEATFARSTGERFRAQLERADGKKLEMISREEAEELVRRSRETAFRVASVQRRKRQRRPFPPFITSTLQQDASRRLGFTAKRTMKLAQRLYEGVEVGSEGAVGLITYMRTDSTRVSQDAVGEVRRWLEAHHPGLLPAKAPVYKTKKSAQDAHEAIRPTSVERTPESLKGVLDRDLWRLYDLIWRRFVASQCTPAVYDTTRVEIEGDGLLYRANGSVLRDPGFTTIYPLSQPKRGEENGSDGDEDSEGDQDLPDLQPQEELRREAVEASEHHTKPPPRYTEATLVKEMEAQGIGRPSTYAATLSTLQERKYVVREKRQLVPTDLGRVVTRILVAAFPDIFEVGFTAAMEDRLDAVEEGKKDWKKLLEEFYRPFTADLDAAKARRQEWKALLQEQTEEVCPECGRPLVKKWGRHGKFLACSGFPECRYTAPLEVPKEKVKADDPCPNCGSEMVLREGRFGRFWSCSAFPKCKTTRPFSLGVPCPAQGCEGGELVEKRSKRGRVFYGCSRYPDCRFTSWDRPVGEACSHCPSPYVVEKGGKLVCPQCRTPVDPNRRSAEEAKGARDVREGVG